MWSNVFIVLFAVLVAGVGLWGVYSLITKQNAAIGGKTVQLVSLILVLPLMLALGAIGVLGRETIGPIIGVIIGYALSGSWKD